MPSAKGPLESTAKPAKRAVDAEATRSLSSPPLKKLNKEAKALEPRTAHGNLAVEDDFFLEDTAQVSDASLSPILVICSVEAFLRKVCLKSGARPAWHSALIKIQLLVHL